MSARPALGPARWSRLLAVVVVLAMALLVGPATSAVAGVTAPARTVAGTRTPRQPHPHPGGHGQPQPHPGTHPHPHPTPAGPARLHLPAHPDVLLVGDSYTEGVGAVPVTNGYAYKIGAPLGWNLTIDGKGGSGYANPTQYGAGVFADRLLRHPADAYDLVVLQGSSNDVFYDSTQLDAALARTLTVVKDRYPRAQVLVLGVTNPYGKPSADLVRVDGEVGAAAASIGAPYIDPLAEAWFVDGDGWWAANPDNGHPSNRGHQAIADHVVADVRALSA